MIGNNFLVIIVLKYDKETLRDIHGPWNWPCEADFQGLLLKKNYHNEWYMLL